MVGPGRGSAGRASGEAELGCFPAFDDFDTVEMDDIGGGQRGPSAEEGGDAGRDAIGSAAGLAAVGAHRGFDGA